MRENLPVVILAAGASRRMGTPKPLLDFDGRSCLDVVLDACRGAGVSPLVVVLGAEADRIRAGCRLGPDVTVVVNEAHERGQASSVRAGLRALPEGIEGFFILPADHPLVEPAELKALSAALGRGTAGESIAIPTHDGRRGHPVVMAASHRASILAMSDEDPLHDYIRAREAEIKHVPVPNAGVVTGMNTEDEYRAALAEYRRRAAARND